MTTAVRASPFALRQIKLLKLEAAAGARLRRGKECIDLHEVLSFPLRFVGNHSEELAPGGIGNGFRQAVVLQHVDDSQTLRSQRLAFVHESRRDLVKVVVAGIRHALMRACEPAARLLAPAAALLCS